MFDIGIWEFLVIAVLALVIFGPDRLPKAAADAARMVRQLRQSAASARSELTVAAGLDEGGELSSVVADLRELDPRRIINDVIDPADLDPLGGTTTTRRTGPRPAPEGDLASPESRAERADPDWS